MRHEKKKEKRNETKILLSARQKMRGGGSYLAIEALAEKNINFIDKGNFFSEFSCWTSRRERAGHHLARVHKLLNCPAHLYKFINGALTQSVEGAVYDEICHIEKFEHLQCESVIG